MYQFSIFRSIWKTCWIPFAEEGAQPPPLPGFSGAEPLTPPSPGGEAGGPPPIPEGPPPSAMPRKKGPSLLLLLMLALLGGSGAAAYFLLGFQYPRQVREAKKHYEAGNYLASYMTLKAYFLDFSKDGEKTKGRPSLFEQFSNPQFFEDRSIDRILSDALKELSDQNASAKPRAKKGGPHPEAYLLMAKLRILQPEVIRSEEAREISGVTLLRFEEAQLVLARKELRTLADIESSNRKEIASVLASAIEARLTIDPEGFRSEADAFCQPLLKQKRYHEIGSALELMSRKYRNRIAEIDALAGDLARYDGAWSAQLKQRRPEPDVIETMTAAIQDDYQWEIVLKQAEEADNAARAIYFLENYIRMHGSSRHLAEAEQKKAEIQDALALREIQHFEQNFADQEPAEKIANLSRLAQRSGQSEAYRAAVQRRIVEIERQLLQAARRAAEDCSSVTDALEVWNRYLFQNPFAEGVETARAEIDRLQGGLEQQKFDAAMKEAKSLGENPLAQMNYWRKYLAANPPIRFREEAERQITQLRADLEKDLAGDILKMFQYLRESAKTSSPETLTKPTAEAADNLTGFMQEFPDSTGKAGLLVAAGEYQELLLEKAEAHKNEGQLMEGRRFCHLMLDHFPQAEAVMIQRAQALLRQIRAEEERQLLETIRAHVPGADMTRSLHQPFLSACEEFLGAYRESASAMDVKRRYQLVNQAVLLAEERKTIPVNTRFEQETALLQQWPSEWPETKPTIENWIVEDRPEYWRAVVFPDVSSKIKAMVNLIDKTDKARLAIADARRTYEVYGEVKEQDLTQLEESLNSVLEDKWAEYLKSNFQMILTGQKKPETRYDWLLMADKFKEAFPASVYSGEIETMRSQLMNLRKSMPRPGDLRF